MSDMEVPESCKALSVDFVIVDGNSQMEVVEDDIVQDLRKIGITVNTIKKSNEDYLATEKSGDYNMLFASTWGAPYDPHSYLESWGTASHVEHSAINGLEPPLTRDDLLAKIENVQGELDVSVRAGKWREILLDIHQQALFLPLWGSRIPYVLNGRFAGFVPSNQAYTYPINTVRVLSGSKNVTIAAGSAAGTLLDSVGPLNPHLYYPNQIFAQDWVFEGLCSYGQDGVIQPALAVSWKEESIGQGQRVTFQLRQGVQFHDGTEFDCQAVKLNFDHVLQESVKQRHAWHGTPQFLSNWYCNNDFEFVLETSKPYYPLLQELTYVRPLRIASPSSFPNGTDTDPAIANSCIPGGFGGEKWDHIESNITCGGLTVPIGTGPFRFVSAEALTEDIDHTITFQSHANYWGAVPDIDFAILRYYENTDDVFNDLVAGKLDMSLGRGPLTSKQVQDVRDKYSTTLTVSHSEVLQNSFLIMNTGRVPTNDIATRRAIIHAINKGKFIDEEFAGLEQPVAQLLPRSAPYCDVDLNPKWSYDIEKAMFINCPAPNEGISAAAKGGIAAAVVVAVGLAVFLLHLILREKQGKPVFGLKPKQVEMVSA